MVKGFEEHVWKEHVRNFKSLGTTAPLKNFNFSTWASGSFERLRLNASTDQIVTQSNTAGSLSIIDFSQNKKDPIKYAIGTQRGDDNLRSIFGNLSFAGAGFETEKRIIVPERFYYSILTPKFDQLQTDEKVRIRSFMDITRIDDAEPYANPGPLYYTPTWEEPDDDNRFSIDFSCVQALDEDIMALFSALDFFDNALGQPNLTFSEVYPDLDQMKKIYFNRLVDKINFKSFFDFFKWFDMTFSAIIEQLIPRKVHFLGINYVVESHVLERHKLKYLQEEIYLQENERNAPITQLFSLDGTVEF